VRFPNRLSAGTARKTPEYGGFSCFGGEISGYPAEGQSEAGLDPLESPPMEEIHG